MQQGYVYIMEGAPLLLRVGYSLNPQRRLVSLLHCGDLPEVEGLGGCVHLLAFIPGTLEDEKSIHHSLKAFRQSGSWYVDCREVRDILIARGFTIWPTDKLFRKPKTAQSIIERRDRMAMELKDWK